MDACADVLIAGGGLLFLTCTVGVFLFLRTEDGQRIVDGVWEATSLLTEATSAAGSAELREFGCDLALVTTVGQIEKLGRAFQNAEIEEADPVRGEMVFVLCQVEETGPSCEDIARTYGAAVAVAEPFLVAVATGGGDEDQCKGVYAADGSLVQAVE